jgi:hypothetical protein
MKVPAAVLSTTALAVKYAPEVSLAILILLKN